MGKSVEMAQRSADDNSRKGEAPSKLVRKASKYEKLDMTKFYKHYRPDDSFFEKKNRDFNFKDWLNSKFNVAFDENLPLGAIGDLPSQLKYLVGALGYLLLLGVFLFFLISVYSKTKNTLFMSLDPNSGDCLEVPLSNTESGILADVDGVWSGTTQFGAQDALYGLKVINFQRSTDGYKDFMKEVSNQLEIRGRLALGSDPAQNLVAWMVWRHEASDFMFEMTGSPRVVFNREHMKVSLSSQAGVCNLTGTHGFNHGAGRLFVQYAISNFQADPGCFDSWSPTNMGYIAAIDGPIISADVDVTSMILAIGVNVKIVNTSQLLPVNTSFTKNLPIKTNSFVDDGAPFMYPISCSADSVCFIIYNGVFMFPVFFHFGETNYPGSQTTRLPKEMCTCPRPLGPDSSCNAMDLVIGFIFYDTIAFDPIREFIGTFRGNYQAIVTAAYNASISALNPNRPFNTADYAFCTLSYGSCSLLLFHVFDRERAVSPYYYELEQSACYNSFTTPHWSKLVETPPFPLVQQYYECTARAEDAFIDSLGIAVGNASFWVPLGLCALLPMVYMFLNYYKDAPSTKHEYGDDEMEEAARLLGLLLLRVRDGKFQSYNEDLVRHFAVVMDALKAAPAAATPAQEKRLKQSLMKGQRRRSVADPDDSDAEDIDPLDDIANAGNHPTGNKAYYDKIRRASVGGSSGDIVDRNNNKSPSIEAEI